MKTITLKQYVANHANTRFVTFFLLNVRLLLSIRLKFISSMVLADGYVEEKKRSFRWKKDLLNVLGFYLQHLVVIIQ